MRQKTVSKIAEIKLSYSSKLKVSDCPQLRSSNDTYKELRNIWDDSTIELFETFYIILLNRANRVIGVSLVSQGGVAGTVVDAKLVFVTALKANASSLILAHNHPSGNLKPSQADIQLTKKLKQAGEVLDITVLDHLIITSESYYSFADEGMI